MSAVPQIHHGLHVADLALTESALRAIGYTQTQPGAADPIEIRNTPEDPVGQQTAHVLGDRYITHFVENPTTGHQIDLIQIDPGFIQPRPSRAPAQGDLTIGVPVADPDAAYRIFRSADPRDGFSEPVPCVDEDGVRFYGVEGQDFIFTRRPDAFAIVYYSERDFPLARRFFEEVIGVRIVEIDPSPAGARRYRVMGIGGRLDIEVRADVVTPSYSATGKRYAAANHFRLLNVVMADVQQRMAVGGIGGFLLGPYPNGFAFTFGPSNETVELYDLDMLAAASANTV